MLLESNIEWVALGQLRQELPKLIGNDESSDSIAEFNKKYGRVLETNDDRERARYMMELLDFVWGYPKINKRFQNIRDSFNTYREFLDHFIPLGQQLGLTTDDERGLEVSLSNDKTRKMLIHPSNFESTKSIKLGNVEFDFGEFGQVAASVLLALSSSASNHSPLITAAIILLVFASIYRVSTEKISEQDASVFWGIVMSSGVGTLTSSKKIFESTNAERAKVFLPPLTEEQLQHSLLILEQLKSVSRASDSSDNWKATEGYAIRR